MGVFKDLTGQKFGRLTVLSIVSRRNSEGVKWLCRCDCGNLIETYSKKLNSGNTRSCGCLQHDSVMEHNITHGMFHTRIYNIWQNMKDRCLNPKNKCFIHYGGRGITITKKWLTFEGFYEDMEHG